MSNCQHKSFLDILRIVAAFAVVLFHVITASTNLSPQLPADQRHTLETAAALLQWHVPVFFMITGYLWLGDGKVCTFRRMFRGILRFVSVLFVVGTGYALMERVFTTRALDLKTLYLSLGDVLRGSLWDHMWYLYSIIGVYLFLPVLKPFFDTCSVKAIGCLTGILFFFTILAPCFPAWFGYAFPVSFPIGAPAFYVCAGGLISKLSLSRRMGLGALPFLPILWFLFSLNALAPARPLGIALLAVCIFTAVTGLAGTFSAPGWVQRLSLCTFGIYLFHPLFLNLLLKVLDFNPLDYAPVPAILLSTLALFLLSWAFTGLLRLIGPVRKYLL